MLYFENDYCEGAHPAILQKLTETNFEKVSGYGTDPYCASAREKIRAACACPEADVQFISGGTQSNAIVIASMLQRWQGVVAAATGHVAGHEAGAIEYTGHKVITLPQHNGKLDAAELRALVSTFYADDNHDHMVFPAWCTSLTPPSMAPCTPRRSWKLCTLCVRSTRCRCSSMVHGWAMVWLPRART